MGRGRAGGNWPPAASGGLGAVCFAISKNQKGKAVLSERTKGELVSATEVGLGLGCIPFNLIIYEAPANMSKPMVILVIFYMRKASIINF